ncbi:hypothetical protein GCM10023116_06160 [Kistimonas scapharcae]|uniref:Anti-sigma-28 factor FlgM C-terminal domain-containing protein n=1 Tax=Kistimonas scapharcae TaxID=1036133 RepID=A0ABP8UYD8_9GAMM
MSKSNTSHPEGSLKPNVASEPGIDWSLVEEVRLAIANGELSIDPDRLAQKIIELETAIEKSSPKL